MRVAFCDVVVLDRPRLLPRKAWLSTFLRVVLTGRAAYVLTEE